MPISENDILVIKDYQSMLGQNMLNVYTYKATQVNTDFLTYNRVLLSFQNNVIEAVTLAQSEQVTHNLATVDNLSNMLDFDSLATLNVGQDTLNIDDFSASISFTLNRTNKLTRNGGKRVGGLSGGIFGENILTVSGGIAALAIANAIEDTLEINVTGEGTVGVLIPVIVGRTPTGGYDLSRVQNISSVTFHSGASTQVSRKNLN